ncbi:MAG TPA: ferric reductase-like transmembrane domain-containing protein [Acidimicrobiales bacterium]|nr:ferric reductase-like transmembrane domain-containing protein [Acidimicrobiales bacterium]
MSTNADWYLMRSSGFVALGLLTVTLALGVANLARVGRRPATRAVATLVHRNASLLAVVFLVVHVLTAISDRYVSVPALAIVVPGLSGYDPFWIGLGAVAVDLIVAVVVTSLLRGRLRYRSWQLVHWAAYLAWPTALAHGIGSGTGGGADTGAGWSTLAYAVVAVIAVAAVVARLRLQPEPTPLPRRPRAPYSRRPVSAAVAGRAGASGRRPAPAARPDPRRSQPRRQEVRR